MSPEIFLEMVSDNPVNAALLSRLPSLGLGQCHLTAGCLFQAVWNRRSGQPTDWGVKDYDVFYFDEDLSWDAENEVIRRTSELFLDLGVAVEVKNQARVHLWYAERFGGDYPRLASAREGIDRYLVECTCVGIDVTTLEVYAPYGLDDIAAGILKVNARNRRPVLFEEKARSYQERWPWLTIEPALPPALLG